MKNKLVQVAGINGCGKSHLLKEYFKSYSPSEFHLFEFGEAVRNAIKESSNEHPTSYHVQKIVDELINSGKQRVVTSHIVHKTPEGYSFHPDYDLMMNSSAYIHIVTAPSMILFNRQKDNLSGEKKRIEETLEEISFHQDLSIKQTKYLCSELEIPMYVLFNERELVHQNLKTLDDIFNEHFIIKRGEK